MDDVMQCLGSRHGLAFPEDLLIRMRQSRIAAVVVIDELENAVPLMESLLSGGIHVMELALRTAASLEAVQLIKGRFPEVIMGVGTVLTVSQIDQAIQAGADFAVAPGTNPEVIRKAVKEKLPFAPGVATPTDIETALSCGCRFLKFFPAEAIGGLRYFRSMTAPYAHLGLEYIPLGGLNESNFPAYLSEPGIPVVGGSWIAPRNLINSRSWKLIEANARAANRKCR